jgi:N-methylhydantoinase A/oxoprolinase/acetone carboxylase beta subunit
VPNIGDPTLGDHSIGADTGGTFTDCVDATGRIAKVPSTPDDPARALGAGLAALGGRPDVLAHGTTVATNALLEGTLARVALVTTAGFADVIEIARQTRPALYDVFADRPVPLVARADRLEVRGRLAADGSELEALDATDVPPVPDGVGAVAVCLLHADLDGRHECIVEDVLRGRGLDVTRSSAVSPEMREYERTVTTVVNAGLRPVCGPYLRRLRDLAATVYIMGSGGGLLDVDTAADLPAALLLSGPAGGVRAAALAAVAAGFPDAVTFDMGGTSTDVALVLGGAPSPAGVRTVAGYPIRLPALDIHTIGAGGGSIAALDLGGALVVGPGSAGAIPGPACYGHDGTQPTVTDADLLLGRLPTALPGLGTLDVAAAEAACTRAGVDPDGIVRVVDAHMVRAVRAVTVERGVDPRRLALVAFGGAGPLHACAVASALGMTAVVVPPRAGVLSAVGLLRAPRTRELVASWARPVDHHGLDDARRALAERALAALGRAASDATVTTSVDCRYRGQGHELTVDDPAAFHAAHERRNGYAEPSSPVEVVALRARAEAPPLAGPLPDPGGRGRAVGPCVLAEPDCTTWVPAGWTAEVVDGGAWVLRPSG